MDVAHAATEPETTCAIYARFSSDMQNPLSAQDQLRLCRERARVDGWRVVIEETDDAVRAGALAGKDGWTRILRAAKNSEFRILLVEDFSRFSRDFFAGIGQLETLQRAGIMLAIALATSDQRLAPLSHRRPDGAITRAHDHSAKRFAALRRRRLRLGARGLWPR